MDLALTKSQEQFVFHDAQYPALCAGLGSGKSYAGITRLVIMMLQNPGVNVAYYLPTFDLLRLRILPGFEELLTYFNFSFSTNKHEHKINISDYGTIIMRSFDKPERIVSYEVAHSVIDELDTLKKSKAEFVWRKVVERNRQRQNNKLKNTIGVVTTPDQGFNGFIYDRWVRKNKLGHELIKAKTTENPFLPDGYVDQIRANYDPVLAEMYINGEFVSLSQDKVYHFFDKQKHHKLAPESNSYNAIHIGIDFNIGGCCSSVFIVNGKEVHAIDEFVSHDTYDFINNLNRFKDKQITIYPDASGDSRSTNASDSDVQLIKKAGYRVDTARSNPAVRDRINSVNSLLSKDRLLIDTDKCPLLTEALEQQGYTDKGEPEKFDRHPAIDDWADNSGYFIYRKFPLSLPSYQANL